MLTDVAFCQVLGVHFSSDIMERLDPFIWPRRFGGLAPLVEAARHLHYPEGSTNLSGFDLGHQGFSVPLRTSAATVISWKFNVAAAPVEAVSFEIRWFPTNSPGTYTGRETEAKVLEQWVPHQRLSSGDFFTTGPGVAVLTWKRTSRFGKISIHWDATGTHFKQD